MVEFTESKSLTRKNITKVSEREFKVLQALVKNVLAEWWDSDFCFMSFANIAKYSKLDIRHVRRTVRSLARKGFAKYGRGLWTEDGQPAGSGYCCTKLGIDFINARNDGTRSKSLTRKESI